MSLFLISLKVCRSPFRNRGVKTVVLTQKSGDARETRLDGFPRRAPSACSKIDEIQAELRVKRIMMMVMQ